MKKTTRVLNTFCAWLVVLLSLQTRTFAKDSDWGIIRGRGLTDAVMADIEQHLLSPHEFRFEKIAVDSSEFANGNTFVRFKSPVAGKKVVIVSLFTTGNEKMEALLSIRTAKTEGANEIHLVTLGKPDRHERRWIFTAGANSGSYLTRQAKSSRFKFEKIDKPDKLPGIEAVSFAKSRQPQVARPVVLGLSNLHLAKELAENFGTNFYTDLDSVMTLVDTQNRRKHVVSPVIVVSSPSSNVNDQFFRMLRSVGQLSKNGAQVTLVTPYLPYARSDKIDQPGVTIGGRLIADLIESAGTFKIAFVRLHAPQSQGFFTIPSVHIDGRKTIDAHLSSIGIEGIVSPDAGFQKEAALYARDLGVKVFVINKHRDPITAKSELEAMGTWNLDGMTLAIVDDETLTGGTLAQSSEFVMANGAKKVFVVVTHLNGDAHHALNSPHISQLVTTNTFEIPAEAHEKIKVLSIAQELADALKPHILSSCQNQFQP